MPALITKKGGEIYMKILEDVVFDLGKFQIKWLDLMLFIIGGVVLFIFFFELFRRPK